MLSRLGIGARLFIAFIAISTLSLSSGVVGWLILREISLAQTRVNTEALPTIVAAQRTAEASARLVATSPALIASLDEPARRANERELTRLADEIRHSTAEVRRSATDEAAMEELAGTVDRLTANLSRQSTLVKERLELGRSFADRAERTIAAATEIVDLSETLVSNASSGASAVVANLYGLIEDPSRRSAAFDALDRLIEEDIYLLDRMFELRLRSSQIGLITNRLTRAASAVESVEIAAEYQRHLTVVRRRIRSIDDPVRRQQAAAHLAVLQQAVGESPLNASLFAQRARLIGIGEEIEQLARADQELSAHLNQVVQRMLQGSQAFALATTRQAERALDVGLYALVGTSLAAITLSGLIVWLYVQRNLVRRLVGLTGAMQRLTDGDTEVSVAEDGTDELKAMARAVRVFRDETKRRRELEAERERINEELRRHREELQQLVAEQTEKLTNTNELLREEADSHADARARAERASRAKSEFLATMSHEIRTPMTGMLGMIRVLADTALSPAQQRELSVIATSGEALLAILNDILDYSKIEAGSVEIDEADFGLAPLLEGIVALMRNTAREKGLELTLAIGPEVLGRHRGDAGKLRQIVFNLLGNAVKFTGEGHVRLEASGSAVADGRQSVEIAIEDTGIGIAAEHLDRIFEPFTQTDPSITRRFGGTGLGLAISRRLAGMISAGIAVVSTLGRGSTFTLTAPLEVGLVAAELVPRQHLPHRDGQRRLQVLVVEDDEPTRLVVIAFLERMGCEVRTAATGFAAIEAAEHSCPDLVLMDLSLPGMDGIEAARRLRLHPGRARLPVIAMSAHVFRRDVDRTLAAGMDGFVAKPIDPDALASAIRRATATDTDGSQALSVPALELAFATNGGDPSGDAPDVDAGILAGDVAVLGASGVRDLLDLAERSIAERCRGMRDALAGDDRARIASLAHSIASAAGSAGFLRLATAARRLERQALSATPAAIAQAIGQCEIWLVAAAAAGRQLVPPASGAPQPLPVGATVAANR